MYKPLRSSQTLLVPALLGSCLFALSSLPLLLSGCLGEETGIPQRHVHGVVTLDPLGLWEKELTPRAETAELNNDTLQTADGPYEISYAYHRIRGVADLTCDEITPEESDVDCTAILFQPARDEDWYRISTDYFGPVVFKARSVEDDDEIDVDIVVMDGTGSELYADPNSLIPLLDDEGNPVTDDEGEELQTFAEPRFATETEPNKEFLIKVTVNADDDNVEYDLIIVGNDPRLHLIESGIEGDTATLDLDLAYPTIQSSYELKVGAYLSSDIESLGNPVGGTGCTDWELDQDSETFWCAWDMHFLQQVAVEADTIIPGMNDGKDNDCDGVADTGTESRDDDGDGYSVLAGDCNDEDPDVHPHRGDTAGDRKDNDCDGWADNGPDDVDNDADGYCENGRDLNGDGFCRGQVEVNAGISVGDCNDANPAIYPGLDNEIPWNSIDDDCSAGDAVIDLVSNYDADRSTVGGLTPHEWPDLEEVACGTNPFDPLEYPVDADGDGLCDSNCVAVKASLDDPAVTTCGEDCIGVVGCTQDTDGDGFHNWTEIKCGSDPVQVDTAMPDFDGDGICDGEDDDADGDGFNKLTPNGGADCHDKDVSIHPHLTDEAGAMIAFNYDVTDGIDNDCDGLIDENRDWTLQGDGTFTQNVAYETEDQDGDGYTLALRDCDDTDPEIHLGNYEVRSANVVTTDFELVHLFAGDVASLNNTIEKPGARRVTELTPYNLQKDRVSWTLSRDEEDGNPPTLEVTGSEDALPVLHAWFAKQPEVGKSWYETDEPNDATIVGFTIEDADGDGYTDAPWAEGHYQELGEAAGAGKTNILRGSISSIEADSWAGDNDGYHITFPEAGLISAEIDWVTGGGDYDARFHCYYFSASNAPNYYVIPFDPSLADLSKPEEGTTIVPLPDGSDCWFVIVGYAGSPGEYTVKITPQGN